MTRSRRLSSLCLAPSFWVLLWDQVRELLPMLPGAESTGGEGNPDLGLGMDPDG